MKDHRRLWVLLQAQPNVIFSSSFQDDIFTALTQLLQYASISDLRERIGSRYKKLSFLLTKVRNPATNTDYIPPFFCVLDEAQVTTTLRLGEFTSEDNKTQRPVLREIWLLWSTVLPFTRMRLVLSGTGIDIKALKDTLESSALKENRYSMKSDIGAFEEPECQATYIKQYLLATWSEPQWEAFLTRAWAWLHGR